MMNHSVQPILNSKFLQRLLIEETVELEHTEGRSHTVIYIAYQQRNSASKFALSPAVKHQPYGALT